MDIPRYVRRQGRRITGHGKDLVSPSFDWRQRQHRKFRKALGAYAGYFHSRFDATPTRIEERATRMVKLARDRGYPPHP